MLPYREPPSSEQDALLAREAGERLAHHGDAAESVDLTFDRGVGEAPERVPLPRGAVTLLRAILRAMASGRGMTLVPENAELTTVEAASVLNVSRPFLIKLLEEGAVPYRRVGSHRRLRMEDVMTYKHRIDGERARILAQLAGEAQRDGDGYATAETADRI